MIPTLNESAIELEVARDMKGAFPAHMSEMPPTPTCSRMPGIPLLKGIPLNSYRFHSSSCTATYWKKIFKYKLACGFVPLQAVSRFHVRRKINLYNDANPLQRLEGKDEIKEYNVKISASVLCRSYSRGAMLQ